MAIKAMMPMPMIPTVRVVRNAWPRMERNATITISRNMDRDIPMGRRYEAVRVVRPIFAVEIQQDDV